MTRKKPFLVAIVGGSASGKTWLADQLEALLGDKAARLSLDDFYRDRSHLPPGRRARINYDHPRAIDWPSVETALTDFLGGRSAQIPSYDFATHSRRAKSKTLKVKPVVLMDGLWLLRHSSLRSLFDLAIFIDCPAKVRLDRRIVRDTQARGRTRESVRKQFTETVEPMHQLHVLPQARHADVRLRTPIAKTELRHLARRLANARVESNLKNHRTCA